MRQAAGVSVNYSALFLSLTSAAQQMNQINAIRQGKGGRIRLRDTQTIDDFVGELAERAREVLIFKNRIFGLNLFFVIRKEWAGCELQIQRRRRRRQE